MKEYINNFNKYKYLLSLFVRNNIDKRYRGASLGIMWSLLNPLMEMVVLAIIFSQLFDRDIENYPLYLISGKLILNYFVSTTNASLKSITGSASILKKISFPKYMVVLSTTISNFIIFLISLIDLVLIMVVTDSPFSAAMLFIPVYLFIYFIFVTGVSLMLSIFNAYFRDVQHLYSVFTLLLTYMSAIFYPTDIVPEKFQFMFYLNPVYVFIEGFREMVYSGHLPSMRNMEFAIGYTIISLVVGLSIFIKYKDDVVNKL